MSEAKMAPQGDTNYGLLLNGVMFCSWKHVPPDEEILQHKRIQALLRTQKLVTGTKGINAAASSGEQDALDARLDRLELMMERLLAAVRFGPMSDSELAKHWLILGPDGMEIRIGPDEGSVCQAGTLLHVKWVFAHLPDAIQECLARVARVDELDAGWKSMVLDYDLVDAETLDEIGRAAFLAQRLSRWPDR